MNSPEIVALAADLQARGEPFCLVTVVRTEAATSAKAGAKAVIDGSGTLHGFIGGGCVAGAAIKVARQTLPGGAPRLIRVRPAADAVAPVDIDGVDLHKSACPSGGTVDLFIEPMGAAPRLIICGASPIAASLVGLARAMGQRVIVAALPDDHDQVQGADILIDGFDLAPATPTRRDAIIVATQGKRDREALTAALSSAADFVGMVGSRKKASFLKSQLREKGLKQASIDRLICPVGLDLGAIRPEEIALSILAQLIRFQRAGAVEARYPSERAGSATSSI